MKTHYIQPFTDYILCRKYNKGDEGVNDYRKATCIKCISAMNPGEQMWHDKNNQAWIDHKARDGRRKR